MSGQSLRNDGPVQKAADVRATGDVAVARSLVSWAARKAPLGLRDRLEEEWLADLMGRQGAFSRVRFGLGCCWATRIIARDFGVATVAAASSASGERLLVAHGGYDFSRFSRRTLAIIAIVCLHLGILYVYLTGLTPQLVPKIASPFAGDVITETPKPRQPAHLPRPNLALTIFESFPPPHLPDLPADPPTITAVHSLQPHVPSVHQVPPMPLTRVPGGPGAGFPNTADFYPPAARRLGEAGAAAVRVCVDPHGRLTANPAIAQSSGIARLDAGALRLAQAGSGHYRPTTENGSPVSSCYAFRIRFQLEDQ